MDKNEKRAVIKYLHMKGLSPQQIDADMKDVLAAVLPVLGKFPKILGNRKSSWDLGKEIAFQKIPWEMILGNSE